MTHSISSRWNRDTRWPALAALLGGCALWVFSPVRADVKDKDRPYGYRPLTRPAVPAIRNPQSEIRNPIDAFLLAKLAEKGLTFAPEAPRAVLLRRLTYDLHGLPPTPEEIDAFERDTAPDAYEKVVDRLLDSPRYGERWATFWLDLVRYAESDGFKADDPRPTAWRYRDYVIQSLNADKPYDRFVREQLAGDELYPNDPAARIATGYLRHYPDEYNAVNLEQRRYEILTDITDTTGSVFLGLTVGCARCHDHKFDPISQEDYFRLQAFFAAMWPVDVPAVDQAKVEAYEKKRHAWEAETAELRHEMARLEEPARKSFMAKRRFRFPPEYQAILDIPEEQRTPLQKQIAAMALKQIDAPEAEVVKSMKADVKDKWESLHKQMLERARPAPPPPPSALGMTDLPQAPPTFRLKRGDWRKPGDEVAPGFLSAIDDREADVKPTGHTLGRRAALAEWLTKPDHPLTGRVMVNRLWQHHFSRGIVATPSDFGVQGDPPTHPELLDWLACEFAARGWGLKAMHRLMVTSQAYRQSSTPTPEALAQDPSNRLFSRMNRRRLEGEALRDSLLQAAGELNVTTVGGPSVYPELPSELKSSAKNWPVSKDAAERYRRSVYVGVRRNLRYPIFTAFDAPDASETCARRFTTTTAPQSLLLLNDNLIIDTGRTFAVRVLRDAGPDPTALIDHAFRLAVGRIPSGEERQDLRSFLDRQTALCRDLLRGPKPPTPPAAPAGTDPALALATADLCHALFNLNEFLYVD
jgi:hypothetical protein